MAPSAPSSANGRAGTDAGSRSPEVGEFGRFTVVVGAVATLSALGGIALAILLDPTFSWTADALSDLSVRDGSAVAFNWGLIGGGAAGVCYAAGLGRAGRPVRAVLLALSMGSMAGVGVFDLTEPLHEPAAGSTD